MSVGYSSTDIANMAISHLGISNQIQSLEPPDQSNQAQVCAFWYPKCRDECIQSAPWNFGYTQTNLVQEPLPSTTGPLLGYAAPGWPYSYQYPTDCLQSIAVTTLAGQRFGPQFWTGYWWPTAGFNIPIPKIPYRIIESQANPGNLAILCDILSTTQTPLYLFYIQQILSTLQFDPMFVTALSYLIGWRAGGALRAGTDRISMCAQMYEKAKLQALAQHLNANQQDLERDSPSVIARW